MNDKEGHPKFYFDAALEKYTENNEEERK